MKKGIVAKKRKIIILIVLLILIILFTSFVVFMPKRKRTEIQGNKRELNLQDNEYMHVETDESGDPVPVPNGYRGSTLAGEYEIDTGFVIYEGDPYIDDRNARETRNQFVWVPVTDIDEFYGTDKNGKNWGKLYSNYRTNFQNNNWRESSGLISIINKTRQREPDIVLKSGSEGYDMDSQFRYYEALNEEFVYNSHDFLIQLELEFNAMLESVKKYGGFYIARYETSNLGDNISYLNPPVSRKGKTNISGQNWYRLYENCKLVKGTNTNIVTGMIWGNQWDRTMRWITETGAKEEYDVLSNSVDWGNYKNSSFQYENISGSNLDLNKTEGQTVIIPTGTYEEAKANNIYDLAGNVSEWTMEASGGNSRVARGGSYIDNGTVYVHSRTDITPGESSSARGCRTMLYIK